MFSGDEAVASGNGVIGPTIVKETPVGPEESQEPLSVTAELKPLSDWILTVIVLLLP